MKKLISLVMILILVVTAQVALAEDAIITMTNTAIRMTEELSALSASEKYLRLYSPSDSIVALVAEIGEKLSGKPQSAWLIQMDTELLLSEMVGEVTDVSELVYSNLLMRVPSAVVSMLIASRGAEFVSAYSILSLSDSFAAVEGMPESAILILDYGTDVASACRFTTEFGCASCTVQPIAWDENTQNMLRSTVETGALTMESLPL